MTETITNGLLTTASAAYNASVTSITVTVPTSGPVIPSISAGVTQMHCVWDTEIILVTANSGTSNVNWTITRGQEGTTAVSHLINSRIFQVATAASMTQVFTDVIAAMTVIKLGGTTSSFPEIKRNAAAINFRLADDSADCAITAAAGTFSGTISTTGTLINVTNAANPSITLTAGATGSTIGSATGTGAFLTGAVATDLVIRTNGTHILFGPASTLALTLGATTATFAGSVSIAGSPLDISNVSNPAYTLTAGAVGATIGIATATDSFLTGSVANDLVIRTSGTNIKFGPGSTLALSLTASLATFAGSVSAVHQIATGTSPTLTTGTGTIVGKDSAGTLTLTAGSQVTLVITFGTAYTTAPICIVKDAAGSRVVTVATSTTTITLTGTFGAADVLSWHCIGY